MRARRHGHRDRVGHEGDIGNIPGVPSNVEDAFRVDNLLDAVPIDILRHAERDVGNINNRLPFCDDGIETAQERADGRPGVDPPNQVKVTRDSGEAVLLARTIVECTTGAGRTRRRHWRRDSHRKRRLLKDRIGINTFAERSRAGDRSELFHNCRIQRG